MRCIIGMEVAVRIVLLCLLAALAAEAAFGCSCLPSLPGDVCTHAQGGEAVFVGQVVEATSLESVSMMVMSRLPMRLTADRDGFVLIRARIGALRRRGRILRGLGRSAIGRRRRDGVLERRP